MKILTNILILMTSIVVSNQFLIPIDSNNEQTSPIFKRSDVNLGLEMGLGQIEKCFSACYRCNSKETHLQDTMDQELFKCLNFCLKHDQPIQLIKQVKRHSNKQFFVCFLQELFSN